MRIKQANSEGIIKFIDVSVGKYILEIEESDYTKLYKQVN